MVMNIDVELDTSGLQCPLPLLRTKKALAAMTRGQVLYVIATDPGSVRDFKVFCKQTGNVLRGFEDKGGSFHFHIEKA
ncbi:MAG: hypothetical protein A2V90_06095 [Gammaproteobacteria bacterium RBG_16_57_12]|nr:MAG: hypothetical protein A2V90_06095 [Gammaproteobacteria bacterium RBG_16_57_12]